ncbi:MAG TPA: Trk system potassium transporter TrkA [bacterium]|nr:Trk system potassium transporter TrkA [bacterium]HPN30419.1 Trk system potassium transporter TrkA [bacterium]
MKIFIVGAGFIGSYLAELLSLQNNDITVVDIDKFRLKEVEDKLDVKTVSGNAVNLQFLSEINAASADLFISVTADDAVNLISALTAKNLGVKKTIARVRNKEFLEGRKIGGLDFFGIDLVFCPENFSANEIAKRIKTPGIASIEFFAKDKILMREFTAAADYKFLKIPLKNLRLGDNIIVVGIYRNEKLIIPNGNDYFESGDKIFIMGDKISIFKVAQNFNEIKLLRKKIMIFGGGNVGFTLANMLENDKFEMKIVEPDKDRCEYLSKELYKTIIINDSALDPDFLESENIAEADTFLALTSNDEDNLISAVLAKNKGVKETLITLQRTEYISIAKMLGIDTVVNPMIITSGAILSFLMKDKMRTIAVLSDEKSKIVELEVNENCDILNQPLFEAKLPKTTLIGAILRNNSVIIPKGTDFLMNGDIAIIITLENQMSEIWDIFYKKN